MNKGEIDKLITKAHRKECNLELYGRYQIKLYPDSVEEGCYGLEIYSNNTVALPQQPIRESDIKLVLYEMIKSERQIQDYHFIDETNFMIHNESISYFGLFFIILAAITGLFAIYTIPNNSLLGFGFLALAMVLLFISDRIKR